ncbi:helix-turn-helix transcriptional regulator [Ralstonia pseudosolanacearum]|uniref:helix-turn-helix transcriptional regulator n=1 Tax=Ralstonia pseudosolanacearum TaxID=1310165 RepID=UPI000B92E334|nr:AlpA family transcriptional regulator [Ralstonia pseudosolanacearum]MCD9228946.1 AlpA family transcriptional regulator [Ralstonia pseudosolanacearum]MDO3518154.1 AlpA family transcriptional regulator [Ralstonia pseudosolanacearum]MDO3540674.1 AlpA family transcriptional regulator [Ralstonia pseudosolanacearum]
MNASIRILRLKDVQQRIGVSRPTIYRWLDKTSKSHDAQFPRPVSLGSHSIGWVESEIDAWLEARIRASRAQEAA